MSKPIASIALRKIQEELSLKRLGIELPNRIMLKIFEEKYLNWVICNQRPRTLMRKKDSIKNLYRYMDTLPGYDKESIELQGITQELIEGFKAYRLKEGVTPRTVNVDLNCISNMLKIAKEWSYVVATTKTTKLRETRKMPRFFFDEEIKRLFDNSSRYLQSIITMGLNSGLRAGEMTNLKWSDIDFHNKLIYVKNSIIFNTKGCEDRAIPINSTLHQELLFLKEYYIDPLHDRVMRRNNNQMKYVFCHQMGGKMDNIGKAFKRLVTHLGMPDTSLHTMRHSFASHLAMNGVDIVTIKELLGHKDIKVTMIYAHLTDAHKKNSIEKIASVASSFPRREAMELHPA